MKNSRFNPPHDKNRRLLFSLESIIEDNIGHNISLTEDIKQKHYVPANTAVTPLYLDTRAPDLFIIDNLCKKRLEAYFPLRRCKTAIANFCFMGGSSNHNLLCVFLRDEDFFLQYEEDSYTIVVGFICVFVHLRPM